MNKLKTRGGVGDGPSTSILSPSSTQAIAEGGIKFPELRSSGVSLRSNTIKLPASIGQKKLKAVEHLLTELSIDHNPMCVEEVCNSFNDIRSGMVIMYELRQMLLNYVFELQTLKHHYESMKPNQVRA